MVVRFEDPPDRHRRRIKYDWDSIYADLRDKPGQWAIIAEPGYMSTYNAIKQGSISNFNPKMGIELRISNSDYNAKPRTCDLHARYNPDHDEHLTVRQREKVWVQIRRDEKERRKMQTMQSDPTVGTGGAD